MDMRQQVFSLRLMSLHLPVMHIALQDPVRVQAIGSYRAAWFDRFVNKTVQHFSAGRVDAPHPDATDATPVLFCSYDNQSLFFGFSTDYAFFFTTPEASSTSTVPCRRWRSGRTRRAKELMQQRPGGLIAAQSQQPLDRQGTASVLLACDVPHCSKPKRQRQMGILKNRAGRDGCLMSAIAAHPTGATRPPSGLPTTYRTNETVGPAEDEQVISARLVGFKATLKLHQRFWIILSHAQTQHIGAGGVK